MNRLIIALGLMIFLFTAVYAEISPFNYSIGPGEEYDYNSISAFEAGITTGPLSNWCTGWISANYKDSTSTTFSGITFATAGITVDVLPDYRASNMTFDVTKASHTATIIISTGNIHINHLQIYRANPGANSAGILINASTECTNIHVAYNIIIASAPTGTYCRGVRVYGGHDNYIYGNLIFGWKYSTCLALASDRGIVGVTSFVYNNTVVDNTAGILDASDSDIITVKNNVVQGSGVSCYGNSGAWGTGSDYNVGDANDTVPGTHSSTGTVVFVNSGIFDFRLDASDTLALDTGIDLSSEIPSIDGIGTVRPQGTDWDMGFLERISSGSPAALSPTDWEAIYIQ